MRTFRARVTPLKPISQRRYQEEEEEEQQERLLREQEQQSPEYEEWFDYSVAQVGREEEKQSRVPSKWEPPIQDLNEISDREFEQLVEYYLRSYGYVVETTLPSGGRGADLLITASDSRISVLLKLQDEPVDNRAVQEA